MELTNNQKKMDLVARLVKDGAIDFDEAIELLKLETDESYKFDPNTFKPNPETSINMISKYLI